MKLLPVYINCLLKSDALAGTSNAFFLTLFHATFHNFIYLFKRFYLSQFRLSFHTSIFVYLFTGGQEVSVDDRSWLMLTLTSMSVDSSVPFFYPAVYPVHDLLSLPEDQVTPVAIR